MPTPKIAVLCSLAVVLVAVCASGSTASLQTPKPAATATLTVSATVSPDARASLSCRLPVISPTTPGDPVPGGWITFPSGNFERDPASLPIRLQAHVPSYDRAIKAWLPVEYRYVAPSGASYILTGDPSGSWTVVDLASAGV